MLEFAKYDAIGNDYIVVNLKFSELGKGANLARSICARNSGVGSDGLILGPLTSNEQGFRCKIYNPDGSEVARSGNAIRIFSKYLLDESYVANATNFDVYTDYGVAKVEIINLAESIFNVRMGLLSYFQKSQIPLDIKIDNQLFKAYYINVGNPHCTIFTNSLSKSLVLKFGGEIAKSSFLPEECNVQFVKINDTSSITMEIWERGVGYTLSSGTSSIAAVCNAFLEGLLKSTNITVYMPGGNSIVRIKADYVYLQGSVKKIAKGYFTWH